MKIFLKISLALCFSTSIIVVACKKPNYTAGQSTSLNQLFSGLRMTPQNLSVTAGRDTVVFGLDSTMFHFYSNSFKDANGNIITNGTISLQLVEMYKPGDMIRNRATTITSSGQILQSGGEINIIATMNGQQVFANKYGIGFKQPGASSLSMALYYGGTGNRDSVTTWTIGDPNNSKGTFANGTTRDTGGHYTHTGNPIIYPNFMFIFDTCTHFDRINCDMLYKYDTNSRTRIFITLPDNSFTTYNTQISLAFPELNCVIEPSLALDSKTNSYFLSYMGLDIDVAPKGIKYEIVAITNKVGSFYYFEQSGIVTANMTINLALVPETSSDIIARLAAL